MSYAELHCLTNFSFLRGASHADELVARAHELGYAALAITDQGSPAGLVRAHPGAKRVGLKLIVGAEMAIAPSANDPGGNGREPGNLKLVILARNHEGYT